MRTRTNPALVVCHPTSLVGFQSTALEGHRTRYLFIALLAIALGSTSLSASEGTLQSWRDDSRSSSASVPVTSNRSNRDYNDDEYRNRRDGDSFVGDLIGDLICAMFFGSDDDDSDWDADSEHDEATEGFQPYNGFSNFGVPYKEIFLQDDALGSYQVAPSHSWRNRLEFQDDFDSVWQLGFQSTLLLMGFVGFDTEVNYWREQTAPFQHDELWTGDFNIITPVYTGSTTTSLRLGGGVNWLSDRIGTEFGWNGTMALDIFPIRPYVLSAETDFGKVGKADLFHGRVTAGMLFNHVEFYSGFDYLKIGGRGTRQLVGGIRLWY